MELLTGRELVALDLRIAQLTSDAVRREAERSAIAKAVARLQSRQRHLRFVRAFRMPAKAIAHWPLLVLVSAPPILGLVAFVAINEFFESLAYAFGGFSATTLVFVAVFYSCFYHPPDEFLPIALADIERERKLEVVRLCEAGERINAVNLELRSALEKRRNLIASGRIRGETLLQQNWKAMRDSEWEDYLLEVCRALGAKVQRTGRSGDQGVDLIVEFGSRRIAVQAKGYYHSVNGSAVQEAVAGVAHYGCNASAVITNSRFTRGAKELAASNRCVLIGEDEFPDFVLGKISIWA